MIDQIFSNLIDLSSFQRRSFLSFRNEPSNLFHERNTLGHGISVFGDRLVPRIHTDLAQHEATAETANADQTSGAQPSSFEAGHRLEFSSDRRGRFLRQTGEIANRGTNGLGSGQRNGPHADGSGEAKAETEPHHRDGAIQPRKSEPYIFFLKFYLPISVYFE